ncbi:MAG: hypothetical protein QME41_10795 [Actinomycetota bacterium]|nr:hypothetical protein [Actinomycetota bacterium]
MLTVIPNVGIIALGVVSMLMVCPGSADGPRRCVRFVVAVGSLALISLALANLFFYINGDTMYVLFEVYARVAIAILWVFLIFKAIFSEVRKEARRREKELEALNEVALAVGQSLDLDKVLDNALKSVVKIGNFDVGFIYLLNQEKNVLEIATAYGEIPESLAGKLSTLQLGQEV